MFALLLGFGAAVDGQKVEAEKTSKQTKEAAQVEREIREFFDAYAAELNLGKGEAIANRYDARGYYRMGNGAKTLLSFEENKKRYVNNWTGPKNFAWKDLSVEVLSKDAAIVTALFDWQIGAGESRTYSYTGLLTRQSGEWRIRVEDESGAGALASTPVSGSPAAAGAFKYLYRASAGASLSAHRHSVDQRIKVQSGRKFILMGDLSTAKVQVFEAGQTLTIPANVWHVEWWEIDTVEEIEGTGPMRTERATPSTPRTN